MAYYTMFGKFLYTGAVSPKKLAGSAAGLLHLLLIFSKYAAGLSAARQNYWRNPPTEPPEPNARKNSESKKNERH
jgi:hypothetical protein